MPKRVLDVGQCDPDHAAIGGFLSSRFQAMVDRVDDLDHAFAALRARSYDLVLVNRKLDIDYSDGLEVIRRLRADDATGHVPIMLVSNYAQYQEEAVRLGAQRGFGKAELNDETAARLQPLLGDSA